jgi:DNA-binding NarL/FixJ family response regulator
MKRTGLLARIRTLVISTDSTDHRIHDMIELGAHGYVTKPFHPEALRQELDRVLGNEYAG